MAKVAEATSYGFQPDLDDDTRELADETWIRLLRPFSREVITHAFDMHGRNHPRQKPTPYQIEAMCQARREQQGRLAAMRPVFLPKPDEGPRVPVSAERAQQIMDEAGFNPERMNLVKRFPKATSFRQAENFAASGTPEGLRPEQYMTPDEMKARGMA